MTVGMMRGPWKKLKAVGKGSFGSVYLVQRNGSNDNKRYVMKEVPLRGLPPKEVASAQNEVAALKRLQHPHCVGYEDSLVVNDTLCIVMEFADGGDLSKFISKRRKERKPLSEAEVLKIFWQLTSALSYCHHEHRMLHRDLKPANVFLTDEHDVKLGDFGLAKVVEATCALAQTQCGTPVYMSPELCAGQSYNRAADVWALGCVLYELMTLQAPWEKECQRVHQAGGLSALLKKIASSQLDLSLCRQRYSSELCSLLASLLHRRGACRPALNNVLLLDIMERAAPKPAADALEADAPGEALPPNWKKVPSSTRKGEFSYLHVPTGFKQAFFPTGDAPSDDVLGLARRAQEQRTAAVAPPPSVHKDTPAKRAAAAALARAAAVPNPVPPALVDPAAAPLAGEAVTYGVPAPAGGQGLPANWTKVPSSSRKGEWSYLHIPTGYKQVDVPVRDAPDPKMFAEWQRANAKSDGRGKAPPPTPMGPPPPAAMHAARRGGALAPVYEVSDASDDSSAPKKPPLPPLREPVRQPVKAPMLPPPSGPGLRRIWTPQPSAQHPPAYVYPAAGARVQNWHAQHAVAAMPRRVR